MSTIPSRQLPRARRMGTLLFALAAASAWPVTEARAATIPVANCNDSGTGSLRTAVATALSGDVIDLRNLTCSRVLLTGGQIEIPQASLTLIGRSRSALTIDGNQLDRVFWHRGTGRLRIEHVSIANGNRDSRGDFDSGGCIRSEGSVELHRTRVHHCSVFISGFLETGTSGGGVAAANHVLVSWSAVFSNAAGGRGTGGGVFAPRVTLYRSQVYGNEAFDGGGVAAGIFNADALVATYSLIHANRAVSAGGGIYVLNGNVTVNKSTVSANAADNFAGRSSIQGGGGMFIGGTGRRVVTDSTISGNRAWYHSAAAFNGEVSIYNSTLAFNVENEPDEFATSCTGPGALNGNVLHLESTIVAANTCLTGQGYDIGGSWSAFTILGENNLIGRARIPMPPETISANPRLAPLAENGGPTRTHLPLADSPALERGSNLLDRAYDQRGPGFPRVRGAFPDIGAVER